MARGKRWWGWLALVLVLGLLAGTILGEIVARILPEGAASAFFGASREIGIREPLQLDLGAVELVLGCALRVNLVGILGLIAAGLAYYRLS
jgi:hypothetical protein